MMVLVVNIILSSSCVVVFGVCCSPRASESVMLR